MRVKPREPRRKVLIDARLRQDRGWTDARILDISSGGLMACAHEPPLQGAYVEIARGTHRIVARVVWAKDGRFGARAQDRIAVDAITAVIGTILPVPVPVNVDDDRRRAGRSVGPVDRHEHSRLIAGYLQFLALAAFGCLAALFAFDAVHQNLSQSLDLVETQLAAQR